MSPLISPQFNNLTILAKLAGAGGWVSFAAIVCKTKAPPDELLAVQTVRTSQKFECVRAKRLRRAGKPVTPNFCALPTTYQEKTSSFHKHLEFRSRHQTIVQMEYISDMYKCAITRVRLFEILEARFQVRNGWICIAIVIFALFKIRCIVDGTFLPRLCRLTKLENFNATYVHIIYQLSLLLLLLELAPHYPLALQEYLDSFQCQARRVPAQR